MRLALDWLKDYVALKTPVEKLCEQLDLTTAEVDDQFLPPTPLKEAVVATITEINPHPQADRLHLVTIKVGTTTHKLVCGAKNIAVGQKVPFIGTGCTYNGDQGYAKLEPATIRGVVSKGMLGSAHDLGFGSNHDGIMILPSTSREGAVVASVVKWDLPVLDLEVTPNRSDLLSYLGLAREIAAINKTTLNMPAIDSLALTNNKSSLTVSVETVLCNRYTATVISGITNQPSPLWLQARLIAHDLNPQNIIVDVTNYVMLELGQPLHAFDAELLGQAEDSRLTIRTAITGEKFTALNDQEYTLNNNDIVIDADGKTVALAGIIGGSEAAISESTTKIVLESANFDPATIRKTALRLGLRTDAVTRFEKGVDPEMTIVAVKRVVKLLREICGSVSIEGLSDANYLCSNKRQLVVSLDRAKRVLGLDFTQTEAKSILTAIGFGVTAKGKHDIAVIIPSWRNDIEIEEDIFEELARLKGYDKVPTTLPSGPVNPHAIATTYYSLDVTRQWVAKNGYRELVSPAFASQEHVDSYLIGNARAIKISNPTSRNEAYYRFSLLPNIISRALNESRYHNTLASFEIGNVAITSSRTVEETTKLAICVVTTDPINTARQIKGVISAIPQNQEKAGAIDYVAASRPWSFCAGSTEEVRFNKKAIGQIGILKKSLTDQGKLRGERYVVVAEILLDPILSAEQAILAYREPHRFPVVTRDITLAVKNTVTARALLDTINQTRLTILAGATVTNYLAKGDQHNITIRLTFLADHTLTDNEVNEAMESINQTLKKVAA